MYSRILGAAELWHLSQEIKLHCHCVFVEWTIVTEANHKKGDFQKTQMSQVEWPKLR